MAYRLLYSQTSREQVRSLHPQTKAIVKTHIQQLKEDPFIGKALEKELSGYHSLRTRKFRVIYRIDHKNHIVQIHYVGHRKDVYELFKEALPRCCIADQKEQPSGPDKSCIQAILPYGFWISQIMGSRKSTDVSANAVS